MDIIKNTDQVIIHGKCLDFPGDEYTVEIQPDLMYLMIKANEYGAMYSVIVSPEDTIKIAKEILNFYEGVIK